MATENTEKAFDIMTYIVDNGLKPGDKLPSIRTLATNIVAARNI
ncbi:MAG: hypothetical protein RSJ41_01560 [Clostridia bacterium]